MFCFFAAHPVQALEDGHALLLYGEPKYKPGFSHFDYVNPNAPTGGTLKLAHSATFDSLNPFILKGLAAPGLTMLFETLMTPSMDEPQTYYGLLAKRVEVAEDGSYADFTLNEKARWHDGEPITAHDVAWSFETLKEKGHPSFRILYAPIEKVSKLGTYQVRFHFTDTANRELPLIAAGLYVLPKHYYETRDFEKTTLEPPLGSGPYKVKAVDAGRAITYERVENYWGKNLPVNKGRYNFDSIIYDVYRDETVALEGLKAGRYDLREEYIARNWATAFDIPAVQEKRLIKEKIPNKIPRGMQAFLFNLRKEKFQDVRVREAISLTMDYEWANRVLFYDAYDRSYSFFQNTDFMADHPITPDELALLEPYRDELPESTFTEVFKNPLTDGSGHARESLIKAQKLLNDAGYVMRDGVRVNAKTGEPLTVELMMRQRTFERVFGIMKKNLARLGISSTFRYVDDSQYQKRLDEYDFDIISIWWSRGIVFPGNEQIGFWHSSQANVKGGNNLSGLQSEAVDFLLSKITSAKDYDEYKPAVTALDRVLLAGHYVIPHWHMSAWRMLYWDKFGQPDIFPPYGFPIDSWWMKPEYRDAPPAAPLEEGEAS